MSVKSWKSEFYPKPVEETSPEEAISHSLKKWEGLLLENLVKHSVTNDCCGNVIDAFDEFNVNNTTCSLCHHYFDDDEIQDGCDACPLTIVRGGISCDTMTDEEFDNSEDNDFSPWGQYARYMHKNPEPMIFWLKKAQSKFAADDGR